MNFTSLGLSEPILRAIHEQGYDTPTPIQSKAIPVVLRGEDLLASAQTGTGKTAGFMLPVLQRLQNKPRAKSNHATVLVLAPTRELAAQIHESTMQYAKYLNIRSTVVFGGVKINPQMKKLLGGVEVLIATPGRLLDLFQQRAIRLNEVDTLVLDEADRMLDMGFIHAIKKIMSYVPKNRQTLLFSATFSSEICQIAKDFMKNPVEISVTPRNATAETVSQKIHPVDKTKKPELLSHLLRNEDWSQALVFSKTKHGANKLVKFLATDGVDALAIHGNKTQAQRTKALSEFKSGKVPVLVATDIAARGIDIDHLPVVINFDLPTVAEDYVHRIGRTGRAGSVGGAVSLVSADEIDQLNAIEKLIKRRIDRIEVDGFETTHHLPASGTVSKFKPKQKPAPKAARSFQARYQDKKPNNRSGRGRSRTRAGATSA